MRKITEFRPAPCHPARSLYAKGLCRRCYRNTSYRKFHPKKPLTRDLPASCHPERRTHLKDLCASCYYKKWRTKKGIRYRRDYWLRYNYKITADVYDKMFLEQDGKCFLCGEAPLDGVNLAVDHNHETGEVRKLLCLSCNAALGNVERCGADWMDRVRIYLS